MRCSRKDRMFQVNTLFLCGFFVDSRGKDHFTSGNASAFKFRDDRLNLFIFEKNQYNLGKFRPQSQESTAQQIAVFTATFCFVFNLHNS